MTYIRRWAEEEFALATTVFKAVIFSGVRQCGKTTLMKHGLPTDSVLLTLDDPDVWQTAQDSAMGFLLRYRNKACVAVDEVQKAPALFHAIKAVVDTRPAKGQFLLSGSSNYKTMPAIHESMAGRLGEVRLRPLTEGEIQGNPPRLIDRLWNGDFGEDASYEECNKALVLQKALQGGYPELLGFSARQRSYWFDAYVDASVKKDFLELAQFRKPELMLKLLRLCGAGSSRMVNVAEAASVLETSRPTVNEYMAALQTMYLIDKIPAWQPRMEDRTLSSPKLVVCDSGLMSYLTGIENADALKLMDSKATTDLVGKLIETWVYQQLAPLTDIGRDWNLYHYRNQRGKEIDFILEHRNGDMICFEVKASEGVKTDHFKNLRWFREQYGKDRRMKTVVLYCGWTIHQYSEDEYALPMAWLWK